MTDSNLQIGTLSLTSRLFLGTSGYPDLNCLKECIQVSQTQLITLGIRRLDLAAAQDGFSFLGTLQNLNVNFLPNTAGCFTANEAVLTANLAKEALKTNRIKLEVIGDDFSLYPDSVELLKAAETLVKQGFEVYPYCYDDVVLCQRLIDLGCVCVMPLAAPIGSGRGIESPTRLEMIRKKINAPIIVDAGIGSASDACLALELGMDAVLLNTAVAKAGYPVNMAQAMRDAIHAGRQSYLAKRIPKKDYAEASTPDAGKIKLYQMKM